MIMFIFKSPDFSNPWSYTVRTETLEEAINEYTRDAHFQEDYETLILIDPGVGFELFQVSVSPEGVVKLFSKQ